MSLRTLLLTAACAVTLSTGSVASAQEVDLSRQVSTISEGDLQIASEQARAVFTQFEGREKTYRASFSNGLRAMLVRTACNAEDCAGLLLAGFFTPPEGRETYAIDEHVRSFNLTYNSAAAVRNDSGQYVIKSYVILNRGITLDNLAFQISVFESVMRDFSSHLANMD